MAARCHQISLRSSLSVAAAVIASYAVSTTPAHAEQWNRFYIGAFAGGAWGKGDATTGSAYTGFGTSYFSLTSIPAVEASATGNAHSQAFIGGIQLGGDRRFNQFVVGAEIDYGAFNLNGRRGEANALYPNFPPNFTYDASASYATDWLFTARGRLGWLASPELLVYLTGGLAVSDVKVSNAFADRLDATPGAIGGASNTRTKAGYMLGGGFEYVLTGPWSIKGEYLYVDLGTTAVNSQIRRDVANQHNPFNSSIDLTANIARVGINYSIGD